MNKYLVKKTLVFVTIILFVGAIFTPNISGETTNYISGNVSNTIKIENTVQDEEQEYSTTSADEWWPMWRNSPGNDGSSSSIAPNTNLLRWKKRISDEIYSTAPVIYNDNLYLSTGYYYDMFGPPSMMEENLFEPPDFNEIINELLTYKDEYFGGIYCLDADTGDEKWNYPLYAPNDPLIVNDKVYATDMEIYGYDSSLYCLDADNGDLLWDTSVGGLAVSPTIGADDKIFFGCLDLWSYNSAVKCYDFDGTHSWTYYIPGNEVMWFSSPAYDDGKVYFVTTNMYSYFTGKIYCLDAETGSYLWSQMIGTFFIWQSSPAVKEGKVYVVDSDFFYSYNSFLKCFNADTGAIIWQYPLGMSICLGSPAVTDDSAYIAALDFWSYNSYMYKISKDSGTLVWKNIVPGYAYFFSSSTPSCSAEKIFILPWEFYGYSETLYCLDCETGSIIWSYYLDYFTLAYPSIADEKVFVADMYGNIYAIEDALKITKVSGGLLSVKAQVSNTGLTDFTSVTWNIDVTGGMLDMVDKHASGSIATLGAGTSKTVRAFPVIGMGSIDIQVIVRLPYMTPIVKNFEGIALGLLVIIKS
jgi:outer membrane protein assembly factor BamB